MKSKPDKDAGSKAWWAKPRGEDAVRRRFAGASARGAGGGVLVVLDAEGGAATAGCDDVRVLDLEAAAHEALGVVDRRAVHIAEAGGVDEHLDALVVEDLVVVALLVEGERVLEPRAAAAAHADAQPGARRSSVHGLEKRLDLLGRDVGQGDHYFEKCSSYH